MSMPRAVRHINEIRVLDTVFRQTQVSRASIARELGLTRSTASNIVAGLIDEGLLIEDTSKDDKSAGTGRPGTYVRLNPTHGLFIGADIGVGRFSIVALDFAGNIVARQHATSLNDGGDRASILSRLATLVDGIVSPLRRKYRLRGLCVTLPGGIDKTGTVLRVPFLGWRRVPLLRELHALFPDMPAIVAENDANAFAVANLYPAEATAGNTEIHLFLDAGIGGAITTAGKLLRGHDGYAGEFGHMILGEKGFAKVATPEGSFESFVGRDAILARYRHHGGAGEDIHALLSGIVAGEQAAKAAVADWAFYLARGLAIITSIFNPTRIVLGGPVAALFDLCHDDVIRNIRNNMLDDQPLPSVQLSPLGLEGPALGGAYLLHRELFSVDERLVFQAGLQSGL